MLKTNPKWMRWDNGTSLDTSSSRDDEQSGSKEVDVKSTSERTEIVSDYVPKNTFKNSQESNKQQLNPRCDNVATELYAVNKQRIRKDMLESIKNYKQKVISNRIIPAKRILDAPKTEMKYNVEEAKYNLNERNWKLREFDVNTSKTSKSFYFDKLRNRKLSSTLSLLFSKIAEERMGDKIEGTDKWDVDKIMFRNVSKKIITNCKYSREKERLVLLLDSSPSCSRMANTYSQISTEASKFDDIEIYDAPNGYAHSIYDPRSKSYRRLTEDELNATLYWSAFDGRTVIYFGDEDAMRSIHRSWKHCDLHWFYKSYSSSESFIKRRQEKFAGKLKIYKCNNVDELMEAVRSMR
tara:strand:- start:1304 stop:2359 length:1056 start_codon:yes stop_codon:yes gene_type:complete